MYVVYISIAPSACLVSFKSLYLSFRTIKNNKFSTG